MHVQVPVLCESLDDLARTSGALDLQQVPLPDFSVTYVVPELDPASRERLEDLVRKRPNLEVVTVEADGWGPAMERVVTHSRADGLLVIRIGDLLHPEAIARLTAVAEQGHDLVVGRRVGQATWGAEASGGPVAVALVSASLAAGVPVPSAESAAGWLDGWHETLLAEAKKVTALEDYPVLAASQAGGDAGVEDEVTVREPSATWDGVDLVLGAIASVTWPEAEYRFAVRGQDGIEYAVPTQAETTTDGVVLSGRLDVGTAALGHPLDEGDWLVGVLATAPGHSAWSPLPRTRLAAGLISGRPVVPTLQSDDLLLQVDRVRRRYFKPDHTAARITESVEGIELVLPVRGPHVARTDELAGSLFLGRLRLPAVLRTDADGTHLQAWLSGLVGRYPMSVAFGNMKPAPLGLTLVVDGVGSMSLEPTSGPTSAPGATQEAAGTSGAGVLVRVRKVVPSPVVAGLRKVPALRRWYGDRVG